MTATTIYPLHVEHRVYREHAATIATALRHYLADLRAITRKPEYQSRRRDFGLSMRRRALAGEIIQARRALRVMSGGRDDAFAALDAHRTLLRDGAA